MQKLLEIEGMSCQHCVMHVKNALLEIDGVVDVSVDLHKKNAIVTTKKEIFDKAFFDAIEDAGYSLTKIK